MKLSYMIMRGADVYSVYRSNMSTVSDSGIAKPVAKSDAYDMSINLHVAREVTDCLLTHTQLTEKQCDDLKLIKSHIARAFDKTEKAVTARDRFARGLIVEELLERQDAQIITMNMKSDVAHGMRRLKEIADSVQPMDRRMTQASLLIREHMMLYSQISRVFKQWIYSFFPKETIEISDFVHIAQELELFCVAFEQVRTYPFYRSAKHIVSDLKMGMEACLVFDSVELARALSRLIKSVYWIFALNYMQVRALTPLSLLIERAIQYRKNEHLQHVPYAKVYCTFEPTTREQISHSLVDLLDNVRNYSDEGFVKPVRHIVVKEAEAALQAMRVYRWPLAKIHLARIARTL